jgi:hypothetical protein
VNGNLTAISSAASQHNPQSAGNLIEPTISLNLATGSKEPINHCQHQLNILIEVIVKPNAPQAVGIKVILSLNSSGNFDWVHSFQKGDSGRIKDTKEIYVTIT